MSDYTTARVSRSTLDRLDDFAVERFGTTSVPYDVLINEVLDERAA